MTELGEQFYKYYFFFEKEETYRRTKLTVTKITDTMLYFTEEFADGHTRTWSKFLRDDDFVDKVVTFASGAAVITKGNKVKAKKLVAAFYQEKATAADLIAEAAFAKMRAVQKA